METDIAIYKQKNSPYFRVAFQSWDDRKKAWVRIFKSTKARTRKEASIVGAALAEAARRAAPDQAGRRTVTRESILDAVNAVLTLAGVETVQENTGWKSYSDAWLNSKKVTKKGARSLGDYASHIKHFTTSLPDPETPLSQVTTTHLREWQSKMIADGRRPATVNNITTTVASIFKQAVAEGLLTRNPVEMLAKIEADRRTRDTFSPSEVNALIAHTRAAGLADWTTVILLGVCTGQRLTDCSNALWTHIDRAAKPWWVWTLTQRKTGAKVEIPLVEPLATHLRELHTGDSLYLCPSLQGIDTGGSNGLSMQFGAIMTAAGIRGQTVQGEGAGYAWNSKTFHSFRHTCNSILANAGVSMDVRRKILGHASEKMNQRYTHLEIETSGSALAGAIGEILSTPGEAPKAKRSTRPPSRTDTAQDAPAPQSSRQRTG